MPRRRKRDPLAPVVAQPWYIARLVWDAVCSALLPVSLSKISDVVGTFAQHLARTNERDMRERQLDLLRRDAVVT